MGIWSLSPPDLVGPLRSLSLHQTLDRGKPLSSLVLSPPSSPTLQPVQLCCSSLQAQGKDSKKERASPYTSMKRWAQCHPSSVGTKGKLEAMKTFWKLHKDLGMDVALESFRKVLGTVEEDMFHDPLSCSDCHV